MRPTALSTARRPATVALAPDHPLVIGRRDLAAAALDQCAVRVEQPRVVDVPPSRWLTPIETTMWASRTASAIASVSADGTVTAD